MSTSDDEPTAVTVDLPEPTERAPVRRRGLTAGETLGRYRVLAPLGRGGMGEVYRAHDPELGRDVAIKLLSRRTGEAEGGISRLLREAQALAKLSHPNVVTVYEVGTAGDVVFLATELVEGETLARWLRGPRSWREVRDVFVQAGRGLAAAHAAGLVHRDFKPANVIVGSDRRVRVLDFGLARATSASSLAGESSSSSWERSAPSSDGPAESEDPTDPGSAVTGADMLIGTPPYMAPEQHLRRPCDARSDQFSFCVSLYLGLYHERPFAGHRYEDLKANVLAGRVRGVPARSDVPRWLRRVVLRGLSVDPGERWPSMEALLAALSRDPMKRWRRLGLAGLGVAGLAVGVLGWWQGRHAAAPRPCLDAGAPMLRVWNAEARLAMDRAFAATRHAHAEEASRSAAAAIDRRASAWMGMRTDACEATRIRGEQSDELLDLRMQCLEQARIDLAAHVELLRHADGELVQRVYESPPPAGRLDECADSETLRRAERLPEGAEARARVDDLRGKLGRLRALQDAGRYREVLPLAEAITSGAQALPSRTLEAEAAWVRGKALDYLGDYPRSREALGQAARAALAGRRDDLAAIAWTALAWTMGVHENRVPEAHEWARYAEVVLERMPARPELRAELWRVESSLYYRERRWDEARRVALRALELLRRVAPDEAGTLLVDLGDIAGEQGLFAEAYDYYRQAQEVHERVLGEEHPKLAGLYNNLGIALSHLGRPLDAQAAYQKSLAIAESWLGPDHPTVGHTLNNLGQLDMALGRPADSLPRYARALKVYATGEGMEPFIAITLVNRADALTATGRPDEALADAERALGLLGTGAETVVYQAAAQQSMAAALIRLGRAREALPKVRAARKVFEEQTGALSPYAAACWLLEGQALVALGRPDEALPPLYQALALRTATPLDRASMAEVEFALARVLVDRAGKQEEALRLARAAAENYRATAATLEPRAAEIDAWIVSR